MENALSQLTTHQYVYEHWMPMMFLLIAFIIGYMTCYVYELIMKRGGLR